MSKITTKLQVTVPKAIASRYRIRPGDDIRFEEAGEIIRVAPSRVGLPAVRLDVEAHLRLFDAATARQRAREANRPVPCASSRGWTREELSSYGVLTSLRHTF